MGNHLYYFFLLGVRLTLPTDPIRFESPRTQESGWPLEKEGIPSWNQRGFSEFGNTNNQIIERYNSIAKGLLNYYGFCENITTLRELIKGELRRGCYVHLGRLNNISPFSIPKMYGANLGGEIDQLYYITEREIHERPAPWTCSDMNRPRYREGETHRIQPNPNRVRWAHTYWIQTTAGACHGCDLEIYQARTMMDHFTRGFGTP